MVVMVAVAEHERTDNGNVDLLLECGHIQTILSGSPVPTRVMCVECMKFEFSKTAADPVALPHPATYHKPMRESGWNGWAARHVSGTGADD